ncbi:MAG: YggN family protein [Aliidiomarina sp.]|uniref:DUF2884 family protein n=1 Tax=Aliidiomarina sp. TaxID=1872439 RepID=UPI0025B9C694|nr:DUF2884 family protein [Aliidiomarina sp.]MCH8501951.1 YggN family protein [Aliidiomarina sp.]
MITTLVMLSGLQTMAIEPPAEPKAPAVKSTTNAFQVIDHGNGCNMSLDKDLYISPEALTLREGTNEVFRIHADGQVYVNGQAIAVADADRAHFVAYKDGLAEQTKFIVEVLDEALEMTNYALTMTFGEMFGKRHRIVRRMDKLTDRLRDDLAMIAYEDNGMFVVQGTQLDAFGDRIGATIEEEMEDLITNAKGSMLMMVGRMLIRGQRGIDEFEQRMETMAANLETEMEAWGADIEARSDYFCTRLTELRATEDYLSETYPAFGDYRLLP